MNFESLYAPEATSELGVLYGQRADIVIDSGSLVMLVLIFLAETAIANYPIHFQRELLDTACALRKLLQESPNVCAVYNQALLPHLQRLQNEPESQQ